MTASADELHGDTVVYGGFWTTIGGTSGAAPKWTALFALTDAYCASQHLPPVGFAAPALYQTASNPVEYAEALNYITSGNNDVIGEHDGAYPATRGYDMASGLGSPRATNEHGTTGLTALLCADGVSAMNHPVDTGARQTSAATRAARPSRSGYPPDGCHEGAIRSGLRDRTPGDINGAGTAITLHAPASPTQPFNGGTPVGGVAVAVSGANGTSATSSAAAFHYIAGSSASPVPSVFYISPSSAKSGTVVTIHGSGFLEGGRPPSTSAARRRPG